MCSKQEVSRRATISVDALRVGDVLVSQACGVQPVTVINSTTYEVVVVLADDAALVYRHGAGVEIAVPVDEPTPDETDARAYVETSARGLIGDLRALITAANSPTQVAEAKLEDLEIGAEFEDGYLVDERNTRERAEERLIEMPLAVAATTTFEVVLGIGGPDRVLCFECVDADGAQYRNPCPTYEIRRVFYRYSWLGSAEVELIGEDRETAEAFGRRVVPELGE